MTELHPHHPDSSPPAHERSRISLKGVVWFVAVLIPFAIFTHVLLWLIYSRLHFTVTETRVSTTALPQEPPATTAPPLQPSPGHDLLPASDLKTMQDNERAEFARRGWADEKGVLRIPDAIVEQVSKMSASKQTRAQ